MLEFFYLRQGHSTDRERDDHLVPVMNNGLRFGVSFQVTSNWARTHHPVIFWRSRFDEVNKGVSFGQIHRLIYSGQCVVQSPLLRTVHSSVSVVLKCTDLLFIFQLLNWFHTKIFRWAHCGYVTVFKGFISGWPSGDTSAMCVCDLHKRKYLSEFQSFQWDQAPPPSPSLNESLHLIAFIWLIQIKHGCKIRYSISFV